MRRAVPYSTAPSIPGLTSGIRRLMARSRFTLGTNCCASAVLRRRRRIISALFARYVDPGALAVSEELGVAAYGIVAKARTEGGKKPIIRARQRILQIDPVDLLGRSNQLFTQRRQRHRYLDRRARLETAAQCEL